MNKKLITIIILTAVVGAAAGVYKKYPRVFLFGKERQFTAVFLDNDQVYFGQMVHQDPDSVVLEHVYYLKTSAPVAVSTEEKGEKASDAQNAKLLLVKLGSELHRPRDRMVINRDHILFTEDMKNEGDIMQAINATVQ